MHALAKAPKYRNIMTYSHSQVSLKRYQNYPSFFLVHLKITMSRVTLWLFIFAGPCMLVSAFGRSNAWYFAFTQKYYFHILTFRKNEHKITSNKNWEIIYSGKQIYRPIAFPFLCSSSAKERAMARSISSLSLSDLALFIPSYNN